MRERPAVLRDMDIWCASRSEPLACWTIGTSPTAGAFSHARFSEAAFSLAETTDAGIDQRDAAPPRPRRDILVNNAANQTIFKDIGNISDEE